MSADASSHDRPLQRGDLMPHFTAARVDGTRVRYSDLWQRRHLVLVTLPRADATVTGYASEMAGHAASFAELGAELVITPDALPGVPRPGVVVADRWGEVYFVSEEHAVPNLPRAEAVAEWLEYIQTECPECQGEAR